MICSNFKIDNSLDALNKLTEEYEFVHTKTSSLNIASENLIQEQTRLNEISEDIRFRLKHFSQADHLTQRFQNPTFSPASEQFADIINIIDECLDYIKDHVSFIFFLNDFTNDCATFSLAELQGVFFVHRQVQAVPA